MAVKKRERIGGSRPTGEKTEECGAGGTGSSNGMKSRWKHAAGQISLLPVQSMTDDRRKNEVNYYTKEYLENQGF
jgi:hypothetical protein